MVQLFMFFRDGEFISVSEGIENAEKEERYLAGTSNDVQMVSVLGPNYNKCWDLSRFKSFWVDVIK